MKHTRILRITSRNVPKRLRLRQEVWVTTKKEKSIKAVMKQIATQELQAKKRRIEGWEKGIM